MTSQIKKYLQSIRGKNIHIIGASGSEGAAIIEFLTDHHLSPITAHDFQPDLQSFRHRFKQTHTNLSATQRAQKLAKIINPKIKLHLQNTYLNDILQADLIFLTQAWYMYPPNFPLLQKALAKKIPVSSLTKLYFQLAPCPIIGITGSNGKSTTTALVSKLLADAGHKVYTAGNERSIYQQILPNIEKIKKNDLLVLEISNRQLTIDLQASPHISILTNIFPNHIAEHGSFQAYWQTKFSLFKYQTKKDLAIINTDNDIITKNISRFSGKIIPFSLQKKSKNGLFIQNNQIFFRSKPWIKINNPLFTISHNQANLLAALGAITPFKLPLKSITKTINSFSGIPHRLETVAHYQGITFVDDLKSSTPTSTISAINAFYPQTIHLIVGGNHKEVNHHSLAENISQKVKYLYLLPGTTSQSLLSEIKKIPKHNIIIKNIPDLSATLDQIFQHAKKGDIVLMSPAGANFQEMHLKNKYSFKNIIDRYLLKKNNLT